jgi:hypothetical protein
MGYILVVINELGNANIYYYTSIKCKRVTRSILALELYAVVYGFDIGVCVKATLDLILPEKIDLVICTDSKLVFDYITKLGTTQEKRLMVDVICLR